MRLTLTAPFTFVGVFALAIATTTAMYSASVRAEGPVDGEVPKIVQYKLDQHQKSVQQIQKDIDRGKFKEAGRVLEGLERTYGNTKKWNKEKLSPQHPAYLALDQDIAMLRKTIDDKNAGAKAAAEAVKPVIEAMEEAFPALENAVKEGRQSLMGLVSVEMEYGKYRKVEDVTKVLENIANKSETANALMPSAQTLVNDLRAQYPTENDLKAVAPDIASDTFSMMNRVQYQIDQWKENKDKAVKRLLEEAESSMRAAEKKLASKKKADRLSAIGDAKMWAINYHGNVIEAVEIIFPVDDKNKESALKLTPEQVAMRAKAETLKKDVLAIENTIAKTLRKRADAHKKKIAANRFPKSSKLTKNKAGVRKALQGEFGKPLRIGVYSPWQSRRESRWVNNHWDIGTFNYIGVWVAAKTPSGKYRAYRTTLRQRKQANGAWGPVKYWGVSTSVELLKKNIRK